MVACILTEDVYFLQVLDMFGKRVKEQKRLRGEKNGHSKPHKDDPHHTNVKNNDQQKRKN
jgi:hypothetical protein